MLKSKASIQNRFVGKSTKWVFKDRLNITFKNKNFKFDIDNLSVSTTFNLITKLSKEIAKIDYKENDPLSNYKFTSSKAKERILCSDSQYKYELAYDAKYLENQAILNDLPDKKKQFEIFSHKLTKDNFVKRINFCTGKDLDVIDGELKKNLFSRSKNSDFFSYLVQRQWDVVNSRKNFNFNANEQLNYFNSYLNLTNITEELKFNFILSILDFFKFNLERNKTFNPINMLSHNADYFFEQNYDKSSNDITINRNIKNIILTKKQYEIEKVEASEKIKEFYLKHIINTDDSRYFAPDNNKKFTFKDIKVNQSLLLKFIDSYEIRDSGIKIDIPGNKSFLTKDAYIGSEYKNNKEFKPDKNLINAMFEVDYETISKIIKKALNEQDKIYSLNVNDEIDDKDSLVYLIKASKLFSVELEICKHVLNYVVSKSNKAKFKFIYKNKLLDDIFENFTLLRSFQRVNFNLEKKNQMGLFYFNGFIFATMYSKPDLGEVENSVKTLSCSKLFNLNITNKYYEAPDDVNEFAKILHAYSLSENREIDTIKLLHNKI